MYKLLKQAEKTKKQNLAPSKNGNNKKSKNKTKNKNKNRNKTKKLHKIIGGPVDVRSLLNRK